MILESLFKANVTLDKCGQVGLVSSRITNTSDNLTKVRRLFKSVLEIDWSRT